MKFYRISLFTVSFIFSHIAHSQTVFVNPPTRSLFAENQLEQLTPFELQLLANFCYLSAEFAKTDILYNDYTIQLLEAYRECSNQAVGFHAHKETLEHFTQTTQSYIHCLKKRKNAYRAWQHCSVYVEQADLSPAYKNCAQTIKSFGQEKLIDFAQETDELFNRKLNASEEYFEKIITLLKSVSTTFAELAQNKFPNETPAYLIPLIKQSFALKLTGSIEEQIFSLNEVNELIIEHTTHIQKLSAQLFENIYSIFYEQLDQTTDDKKYFNLLFDENGFINQVTTENQQQEELEQSMVENNFVE